ncbi:MAG: AAA family ATPase [Burkholderiaceae bacterium]
MTIMGANQPPALLDDPSALRAPPQSIEAEQSVLGGLLLDNGAWGRAADIVTDSDFYRYEHKLIFGAIGALIGADLPADVITVFEQLRTSGKADDAGGLPYLNQLAQSVPSAANMRRYAEIVAERAQRRAVIARADELTAAAFRGDRPVVDLLADAKAALAAITDARQAARGVPLLTLKELREQAHAATWLVKQLLPTESMGLLFGASGTFKSFLAVDLVCHVAHGLPWLGRRTKQGAVVYLAAEGGGGLWKRVCAWHKARKLPWDKAPLHVIPTAVDLVSGAGRVAEAIEHAGVEPALVVIDTLSQTYGGEENSSSEVAAYFRAIANAVKERWHCAVLLLHHSGHTATERPRGSSAMQANTDYMFGVFRDEKEMLATLTCAHVKDGERFNDAVFSLSSQTLGTDEDGDEIKSLVARHLSSAEELQDAMEREGRAGRGGNNQLLLSLLQSGILESDLRQQFYRECSADNADARKKAYQRARDWATRAGFMEVSGGYVITLKAGRQGDTE